MEPALPASGEGCQEGERGGWRAARYLLGRRQILVCEDWK
jgi:hypothetical protein